jgi:hypothetical protein
VAVTLLLLAVEAVIVEIELLDLVHAARGVGVESEADRAGHEISGGSTE